MAAKEDVTVAGAVRRDLAEIAKSDRELAQSTLAMSALRLASEMDNSGNSATSKSMCARELRDTLDRLRELCPKAEAKDKVDELGARRDSRRKRSATA